MKDYLKHSRHDQILGNALIFIYAVMFIPTILLFITAIIQKEFLFSGMVVIVVLIMGVIFTQIEKMISKKMANRQAYYIIPLKNCIKYDDLVKRIDEFKNKKIRFDYQDYANIFSIKGYFNYRILTIYQESFSLQKYKTIKKNVNHAYNKKYDISSRISPREASASFDVNIICCDNVNNELFTHMSNDAEYCLRRVVGLMEVAVVGNKLIIPSIRTHCEPPGINHYVRFNKLLFKLLDAVKE